MVRGSKDLSEKQDPGVGLLGEGGGKPMKWSQTFFKNERKKGQKSKPKREWHSYPPLWPLGTEQQVVVSNPPQKKQGRLKRKRSPIPYPKPVNKIGSLSSRKKGFRERQLLLSPLYLTTEPHSRAQIPLLGALCWFISLCSVFLGCLSFI